MAKNQIIEAPKFEIAAMEVGTSEVADLIRSNVGPEGMDAFDLTRAINPTGKNAQWEIPGLDEDSEMTDCIEGIVIYHRLVRTYWQGAYKGGGAPPDCSSADSMTGDGVPGGICIDCPLSKFGSAENGGQACRVIKQLFILRTGELLPILVNVTAVNIKHPRKYFLSLLSKRRLKFNKVITRIRLEPDKSASGFDYGRTDFSMVSLLPEDQMMAAEEMTAILEPLLSARSLVIDVTPDAVAAPGETFDDNLPEVPF